MPTRPTRCDADGSHSCVYLFTERKFRCWEWEKSDRQQAHSHKMKPIVFINFKPSNAHTSAENIFS
jgi:hypothetical protein